jgi:hypothetical protein
MVLTRPQWPHTLEDIVKALDGVWGIVGATSTTGNLLRLERSLNDPLSYTLVEYEGQDEQKVLKTTNYTDKEKFQAVGEFARLLGFGDN